MTGIASRRRRHRTALRRHARPGGARPRQRERAPADLEAALQRGLRAALRPQEAEGPLAEARGQVAQRAQVPLPPGRAHVQDVRQKGDQAARGRLCVRPLCGREGGDGIGVFFGS